MSGVGPHARLGSWRIVADGPVEPDGGAQGTRKSIRQGGETGMITALSRDGSPASRVHAAGLASLHAKRAEHGGFG